MSTFSINTFNFDKISEEILYYEKKNNGLDPYIFISDETAEAIKKELGIYDGVLFGLAINGANFYSTFMGHKLFINNDLKFGVVEIR